MLFAGKKTVRRLFGLNSRTRSKFLPHIMNVADIRIQLLSRFSSFYFNLRKSDNVLLTMCYNLLNLTSSKSIVSLNIKCLCTYLDLQLTDLNYVNNNTIRQSLIDTWLSDIPLSTLAHSNLIIELLKMKKNPHGILTFHEIIVMLNFVCLIPD